MLDKVVVVGGGSAGFMAAVSLKRKIPRLDVRVIRSKEIGIIGVGEGSAVPFSQFLHGFLGLAIADMMQVVRPSIKLGTCFLWGPRKRFFFPFARSLGVTLQGMSKPVGYYCADDLEYASPGSAFMCHDRAFEHGADGRPMFPAEFAYHIENESFAQFLEFLAVREGVRIFDDTIRGVRQDSAGITALELTSGRTESADLYVDCSGFRSLLLGQTLKEPFRSYASTLYCDRAIVGGWDRTVEPIHPYTTAETMDAGWCWQIEHPHRVNRGYVYSSQFISDEAAERELRAKNPLVGPTRIVKFLSGRYQRSWVKNAVAIGNSSGFVEPLEATALAIIGTRCMLLIELLNDTELTPAAAAVDLFNNLTARVWDSTRRFLATHYKFNTRLDTPFWRHCRSHTDLAGAEPLVEYYQQVGPSHMATSTLVDHLDVFGIDGYLTTLLGQCVPFQSRFKPPEIERLRWNEQRARNKARALGAMTVAQGLARLQSKEPRPQFTTMVLPRAAGLPA